jgi:hypothetical protein
MGRKKKPIPEDPEQYARFVETAERIEVQGTREWFKSAVKRILLAKQQNPRGEAEEQRSSEQKP